MAKDPLIDPWKRYGGQDYRRSSRVKSNVPLLVYGQNIRGEKFVEKTQAIDLNLHGCSFFSRHSCLPGSYVTLRFGAERYDGRDKVVRAQVKRSDLQSDSRRMLCIGVELGIPGNVWSHAPVPMDWRRLLGSNPAAEPPAPAAPVLVTREKGFATPATSHPVAPLLGDQPVEIHLELDSAAPAPALAATSLKLAEDSASRDTTVLAVIEKLLEPRLARALSTLDLQTRASLRQLRETAFERPAHAADPVGQDLDALLNDRLAEIRAHWDVQLDGYLVRMEECVQRMERQAALAERKLTAAQELVEKTRVAFSRQLEEQTSYAVKRAGEVMAEKAALSVDHQLVRLTEDAHFVAREINSMVESDSAAARVEMEKALHGMLEELRSQSQTHAKLLASETRQKVASALAAVEAEHLALCETRMKTMDSEIAATGAKVTTEFRQGLRAFFYSCLVAAVGAVEEHSKTTLDGISSDPNHLQLPKV